MSEEKARNHAQAVAAALGITFYVVRAADGQFSPVQRPTAESEIIATITPLAEERSVDDVQGFGDLP